MSTRRSTSAERRARGGAGSTGHWGDPGVSFHVNHARGALTWGQVLVPLELLSPNCYFLLPPSRRRLLFLLRCLLEIPKD